jgi:aryl-alcohol dehydrogenase-like predicted oxidoreductase
MALVPTTVPRRPLGRTGMDISVTGVGSWAIGGPGYEWSSGPQDDAASVAALRRAVDAGVNWIDTAAVYGLGHAEEVVARALGEIPADDRPFVFTKCGVVWSEADHGARLVNNLRPASIRRECEDSLRRLGIERIDLLMFHWPDAAVPVEESWGELSRLVDEGKVRAAGVSNFDVGLLERCERVRHVDSLEPPFSMIRRAAAADVVPWCAAHGTGVIAYSPMQMGLLTDSFDRNRVVQWAPDDIRRNDPQFNEPALSGNLALRDSLRPVAARHGTTVAAVALAWALAWQGVSGTICGARSPDQVEGWIRAGEVTLADADLDEIARGIESSGAGSGPARPS